MYNRIHWEAEGVDLPDLDYEYLSRWIDTVAKAHGRIVGPLAYLFCNDEKIIQTNRQFLGHDYYTDIITFDYSRGKLISGDMVISLDTVLSNSQLLGVPYVTELHRVIIHGILHLCGINDKAPGEREVMEAHEDEALRLVKSEE